MSTSTTEMQQRESMDLGESLDILTDVLGGEGQSSEAMAEPVTAIQAGAESQPQSQPEPLSAVSDTEMQAAPVPAQSLPSSVEYKITAEVQKFINKIKNHDNFRDNLSFDSDVDPFLVSCKDCYAAPCVSDLNLGDGKDWRNLPYIFTPFEDMRDYYVHSGFFYKWKKNVKIDAKEFELDINNVIFRPSEKGFVICNFEKVKDAMECTEPGIVFRRSEQGFLICYFDVEFEVDGKKCKSKHKLTDTSIVYASLQELHQRESTDKKLRELDSIGKDENFITLDNLIESDSHLLEHLRTKCLTRELNKHKMGEEFMDHDSFGTSLDPKAIAKFEGDVRTLTASACPYLDSMDPKSFTSQSTWRKHPYIIILSQKLGLLDIHFFSYASVEPLSPDLVDPTTNKKNAELRTHKVTVKPNVLGIALCDEEGHALKQYKLDPKDKEKAPKKLFEKVMEELGPSDLASLHSNGTHIVYEIPFAHLKRAELPLFEYLEVNRETLDARKQQMLEKYEANLKDRVRRQAVDKLVEKTIGVVAELKRKAEKSASGPEGAEKKKDEDQKKEEEQKNGRDSMLTGDVLGVGIDPNVDPKIAQALELIYKHKYYGKVTDKEITENVRECTAAQQGPYLEDKACLDPSKFNWKSWPYMLRPSEVHPGYFSLSFLYYDCTGTEFADNTRFKMTCMEIEFRPDMNERGDRSVFKTYTLEDGKAELEPMKSFNSIDELVNDTFAMFARNALGKDKFWVSFRQLFEDPETLTARIMKRKLRALGGGQPWRARSMAALAGALNPEAELARQQELKRRQEFSLQGLSEEEQIALALKQSEESTKQGGQAPAAASSSDETKKRADKDTKAKREDYAIRGMTEEQMLALALEESVNASRQSGPAAISEPHDDSEQELLQEALRLSMASNADEAVAMLIDKDKGRASEPVAEKKEKKEKQEGQERKEREEKEGREVVGAASQSGSPSRAKKALDAIPGLYLSGFSLAPAPGGTSATSATVGSLELAPNANATDRSAREGKRTDKKMDKAG